MRVIPLTPEAITHVIAHLSADSLQEAKAFGMTRLDLYSWYVSRIGAPFSLAFLDSDGIPLALISLEVISLSKWRSRFVATECALETLSLPLTRFLRRFSDRIVSDTGKQIEILSASGNEKAGSWFSCLGFNKVAEDGGIRRFVKGGGCP